MLSLAIMASYDSQAVEYNRAWLLVTVRPFSLSSTIQPAHKKACVHRGGVMLCAHKQYVHEVREWAPYHKGSPKPGSLAAGVMVQSVAWSLRAAHDQPEQHTAAKHRCQALARRYALCALPPSRWASASSAGAELAMALHLAATSPAQQASCAACAAGCLASLEAACSSDHARHRAHRPQAICTHVRSTLRQQTVTSQRPAHVRCHN